MFRKLLFGVIFYLLAHQNTHALEQFLTTASEQEINNLTLDEIIPPGVSNRDGIISELEALGPKYVRDANSDHEYGITFSTKQFWVRLAARAIRYAYDVPGSERIPVGSWGCGYGHAEALFILAGANLKAFDGNSDAAHGANNLLWKITKEAELGDSTNKPYTMAIADVEMPDTKFMNRKNMINICFNVMHFLTPDQNNKLLQNLFENTLENGFVIICAVSFDEEELFTELDMASEYPGFLTYETKSIINLITREVLFQFSRIEALDENLMHTMHKPKYEIIEVEPGMLGIVKDNGQTYDARIHKCASQQRVMNFFTIDILKNLLEKRGFIFLRGFNLNYSDCNMVLVIAQKPADNGN